MGIGLKSLKELLRGESRSGLAMMAIATGLVMLCAAATACQTGADRPESPATRVTVPDDISRLPSDEVERRLGGLLGPDQGDGPSLSAPDGEPTATPTDPLDEIINALQSKTLSELLITVSPSLLDGLHDPHILIKTPPAKGTATALSTTEILFVPDDGATGSDSFEYELMDGQTPVFSSVVQLRPPSSLAPDPNVTP